MYDVYTNDSLHGVCFPTVYTLELLSHFATVLTKTMSELWTRFAKKIDFKQVVVNQSTCGNWEVIIC